MGKTFHHQIMRALDDATYQGETIPHSTHYAMRQALRKANMRGNMIETPKALAWATLRELAK